MGAAEGIILAGIAILGLFGYDCSRPKSKDWLRVLFLFIVGITILIVGVEMKTNKNNRGRPLTIGDLEESKTYQALTVIPEYELLLIREGETAFRCVTDPQKKLQGGEEFTVSKGNVQVIKANK